MKKELTSSLFSQTMVGINDESSKALDGSAENTVLRIKVGGNTVDRRELYIFCDKLWAGSNKMPHTNIKMLKQSI